MVDRKGTVWIYPDGTEVVLVNITVAGTTII